jgi:hypothetical protein
MLLYWFVDHCTVVVFILKFSFITELTFEQILLLAISTHIHISDVFWCLLLVKWSECLLQQQYVAVLYIIRYCNLVPMFQ